MAQKPNLSTIIERLSTGNDFQLTRQQYISETGADIPQNKTYTKTKSAVAQMAKLYDYSIEVIPEILIFKKKRLISA